LLAAIKALQETILNCWPRIGEAVYLNEVIKSLSLCWASIAEDDLENRDQQGLDLGPVKRELIITSKMLVKSVEGRVDIESELSPLINQNPSLADLFPMCHKP